MRITVDIRELNWEDILFVFISTMLSMWSWAIIVMVAYDYITKSNSLSYVFSWLGLVLFVVSIMFIPSVKCLSEMFEDRRKEL